LIQFKNAIITASAGTGKTYRLSLEFIALILKYYEHPDFQMDSILALTFTRKATAEIRERIVTNLEELIQKPDSDLIPSLRRFVPGDETRLTMRESNILLSAWQEISQDMQKLQIMTIDSYTGSIFRNIVRPMKSIDSFEIDENAVDKRMPLLLDHLMKPEFRVRINKLLSRKVQRSMDDYAKFFKSMIYNRCCSTLSPVAASFIVPIRSSLARALRMPSAVWRWQCKQGSKILPRIASRTSYLRTCDAF